MVFVFGEDLIVLAIVIRGDHFLSDMIEIVQYKGGENMAKQVWVSPRDNGWAVKSAGSSKASKIYSTKADALNAGRQQAINNHAELVSQKRNGQINLKNSYGKDPMPPRDKD